jgi:CheY-like chemotaxis protein
VQIEYRILWFEDQPTNVKPFEDNMRTDIARLGFEPRIEIRRVLAGGPDPLLNLPAQQEVDLVLVDWKLGGGQDGAVLARRIRQLFRDTSIVFYSAESPQKLRQLIFDQGIDGVYVCSRERLGDRTMSIVRSQMRKLLDLNHMRGIVMATTSDLDQLIIECLEAVQLVVYPDEAERFANDIATRVAEKLRERASDIEKLAAKGNLQRLLRQPTFEAALRLALLQEAIGKIADRIEEIHLVEILGRYLDEVVRPRNDFAHRGVTVKEGKLVFEGREEPLDQEGMVALRLRLLEHLANLRSLLRLLREMGDTQNQAPVGEHIAMIEKAVEAIEIPGDILSDIIPRDPEER